MRELCEDLANYACGGIIPTVASFRWICSKPDAVARWWDALGILSLSERRQARFSHARTAVKQLTDA
ncbi:hypothetical protein BG74_09445 [Sodalis-like endosymbiont of Proechinophthirus fluctus]|uniref:hypothetical protein n=1 Tax=Sodalis-like endosymbiont of Proechinophthirus fluctus TaxID=1462730 RepID=UPI0007A91BFA|nr:hypothetical protein [Sodalis-like endosymbiont of Proechinophthirus fluctus]KYP95341.1 hypothetical protein BG74_09445 [Sodalis-like endosymbiont of Proechinophthirus fluctus]